MKLTYTTSDGRLTVELEGSNDKELFRKLAHFQEIFEDVPSGKIGDKLVQGGDVVYKVRHAEYEDEKGKKKMAEYFEKIVTSGPLKWYKKSFGVYQEDPENLFPKSKVADDPNVVAGENGWHKYQKQFAS